jgi:hypothetical protein
MSTKSCCIRSCRTVARDLGIATALLAAIGLAPVHAAAANDDTTDPSVTQPGATDQQQELDSQGAPVSAPSEGQDVRAAYQEQSGEAKASLIEAQGEEASTLHVMSPSDPDWNETHQGG